MDYNEDILFQTTSNISIRELEEKYGKLLSGNIFFMMAEHKNFEAAKAEFDTLDAGNVFDMHYFLYVAYPFYEWLDDPIESFIARAFAMKLISEYNNWPRPAPEMPLSQDALTLRRLAGVLPQIDIAGTLFTIDWKNRELRETANPINKLDIRIMELSPSEDSYLSYYHLLKRENYVPEEALTEMPQNVMLLEIPREQLLDPFAAKIISCPGIDKGKTNSPRRNAPSAGHRGKPIKNGSATPAWYCQVISTIIFLNLIPH